MSTPKPARLGAPLTDREVKVLDLTSRGLSGPAIGHRMFLSHNTVKTHIKRIYAKLGVGDRAHAVRVGFQLGYLTLDAPVQRAAS